MMRRLLLAGLLLALAGCAETDPYLRPGQWQPEGANAGNMAAMVANPADLVRGRDAAGPAHRSGEQAVKRLWSGQPAAALPNSPIAAPGTAQPAVEPAGN